MEWLGPEAEWGSSGGLGMVNAIVKIRFAGLLGLAIFAVMGCGKKEADKEKAELRTAKVERADIRDVLTLSGVLESAEEVIVKSEVSGQIRRIRVIEGDSVSRGDTLLEIDPEQLRNRQVSNQLSLSRSRILHAQARRNLALAESLKAVDGISAQKIQDQRWQADLTRLQVQQDSLSLREIEIQLRKTAVLSPITGYLISLEVKTGEVIQSGTGSFGGGTALGTVADLSTRRVTVKVSELDYPNLRVGQDAFITTEAKPGARFHGKVEYVGRMAKLATDRNVRQFDVRVALDPLDADGGRVLPPGATVTVEFTLIDVKGVLTVPYEAVRTGSGEDGAYVLLPRGEAAAGEKAKPEKRKVVLGANNFNRVEIVSGLQEGETIITDENLPRGKGPSGSSGVRRRP